MAIRTTIQRLARDLPNTQWPSLTEFCLELAHSDGESSVFQRIPTNNSTTTRSTGTGQVMSLPLGWAAR